MRDNFETGVGVAPRRSEGQEEPVRDRDRNLPLTWCSPQIVMIRDVVQFSLVADS